MSEIPSIGAFGKEARKLEPENIGNTSSLSNGSELPMVEKTKGFLGFPRIDAVTQNWMNNDRRHPTR